MNTIFFISIGFIVMIFSGILYALFKEIKKECISNDFVKLKRLKEKLLILLGDYSIFGQGVGASVSGFTIVELIKDTTSILPHELLFVFLSGVAIFEVSRRLFNRLKNANN